MSHHHTPKISMPKGRLALAAALLLTAAPAAFAQSRPGEAPQPAVPAADPSELTGNRGIDRRLDRDEKTLRELREIVLQAKAQGKPVEVKDAGPDPMVTDMQTRLDDLDQTLRRLNGQVETMGHDLDLARKAAGDADDAVKLLAARLDKVEAQLQAQAVAPAVASPAGTAPAGAAPAPDAAAADEPQAYRQARQVLDSGDYAGGAAALQDYLQRFPTSPRAAEANYWLGRTLAVRNMHPEAASAYARSLKGWPQTAWAGDAVVRLADSLIELKRTSEACSALEEFANRYAAKASPAVKARAKDTGARAACR